MITKVYINHTLPKKCVSKPKLITIKINLRHILKGDFDCKVNNKATIKKNLTIIIFHPNFSFIVH